MIAVSSAFKTAMKQTGKELKAYLTDGDDTITESDDLQSIKIISEGGLCRTTMKEIQVTFFEAHSYLDKYVNVGIGVKKADTTYEYIDYGAFKVIEQNYDKAVNTTSIKAYDRMYEALQVFAITPTYPITMADMVSAICTELGWTLDDTSAVVFPNSDMEIASDLFTSQKMTYRDVLNQIAEASGSIIYFNEDDELAFRQISDTVLETLTTDDVTSLKIGDMYGELNSVVLSRQPQEDNIVQKDDDSIATYGLNEFKIVNNSIVDSDRETWITEIYNALFGIKYYPFEADTQGLGYFEIGDRIKVTDKTETTYEVLVMNITLSLTGGLEEKISATVPEKSTTPYQYAGVIGQRIANTEIKVDKVNGDIAILSEQMEDALVVPRQAEAPTNPEVDDLWLDTDDNIIYRWTGTEWLATSISPDTLDDYYTRDETDAQISLTADQINLSVSATQSTAKSAQALAEENSTDIVDIQSDVTELQVDVSGLEISVTGLGGVNLLLNSTGLKGTIEEWQELDENGDPIDANNNGSVVQTSDVEENSESGSAIKISEQFITQTRPAIIGQTYTLYFRFKKLLDCDLTISGISNTIPVTAGDYVDETWAVFKYQFVANDTNITVTFSNVSSGLGAYCLIADAVLKVGDCNGWSQAPNEVYGKNYKFDKNGFSVTSPTDYFKAVLDNVKLGIYDTSGGVDKIMALFSKDAGLITSLVAQDELVLQRYQNSEKSTRFIPSDTGCKIVVND